MHDLRDAFHNPIVVGTFYTVMDGQHQQGYSSIITGKAIKILFEGKRGIRVTMKLTKVESYFNGNLDRTQTEDLGTRSYFPSYMFPTPQG